MWSVRVLFSYLWLVQPFLSNVYVYDKYYFIGGYYSPENLIIIVMFNDFLNFLMYQSCNKKLYLPITAGMPKYKGNI